MDSDTDGDRGKGPTRGEASLVSLGHFLHTAFDADDVALDVLSLTSETLDMHLGSQAKRIAGGEISPRSIRLRLILPDVTGIRLAFPRAVGDEDDDRPRRRHREMVISHARSLRESLMALQQRELVEEVSVRIRKVPLTPTQKLYLLNGEQLLEGYYTLDEWTPAPAEGAGGTIVDSIGLGAELFPYSRRDQAFKVEAAQRFFDSYWNQLAQEMDLSGD
ncbi:hypothetical protein [Streptomyces beijiangensis]|uniref:Uncharacterized protein n=1 Tax=Streptomyces beijiangensis TaxID=163361 RepID=A0A939FFB6_9ACTN|nr:hypothetical protein [Streptomyces beijiangensis]MBO0517059.1 hypothetical protein [Streptomyces beijiangensis]